MKYTGYVVRTRTEQEINYLTKEINRMSKQLTLLIDNKDDLIKADNQYASLMTYARNQRPEIYKTLTKYKL
tara:strand:- start:468 stop:680 length:213 start_codon:yes stop_codon:yes gene_type:complete